MKSKYLILGWLQFPIIFIDLRGAFSLVVNKKYVR